MNYKPIDNKVVLKAIKEHKTASGVYVPDLKQDKAIEAEVVAVGPGNPIYNNVDEKLLTSNKSVKRRYPMQVQVGDVVVIPKFGLYEYKDKQNKEIYLIGKETDILIIKK